jgi:undecaprenyl-diphosphatase
MDNVMTLTQAAILGLVEGVTEYLPVSSTGHLILVDNWLGLRGNGSFTQEQKDAIEAFEIVIQSGAIIAVLYAYTDKVRDMLSGLIGKNPAGKKLLINITAAFIPAMVIGLLLHKVIKTHLQQEWPTVFALAIGGVAMVVWDRSDMAAQRRANGKSIDALDVRGAVKIGLLQCVAMWPGTSRSMMTILGGQWVGLSPVAAAEFSFLLGLPTLLAATTFKAVKDGHHLINHVGVDAITVGLAVAAISAFLCVKGLVAWLGKHGLQPFGWYRMFLAVIVALHLSS